MNTPDQTPRSVAPDLDLHCLPMSQKWDARLIWVISNYYYSQCSDKIYIIFKMTLFFIAFQIPTAI